MGNKGGKIEKKTQPLKVYLKGLKGKIKKYPWSEKIYKKVKKRRNEKVFFKKTVPSNFFCLDKKPPIYISSWPNSSDELFTLYYFFGVKVIISLCVSPIDEHRVFDLSMVDYSVSYYELDIDKRLIDECKMKFYHFPLMDASFPTKQQMLKIYDVFNGEIIDKKNGLLIHCKHGVSRSFTIGYSYLLLKYFNNNFEFEQLLEILEKRKSDTTNINYHQTFFLQHLNDFDKLDPNIGFFTENTKQFFHCFNVIERFDPLNWEIDDGFNLLEAKKKMCLKKVDGNIDLYNEYEHFIDEEKDVSLDKKLTHVLGYIVKRDLFKKFLEVNIIDKKMILENDKLSNEDKTVIINNFFLTNIDIKRESVFLTYLKDNHFINTSNNHIIPTFQIISLDHNTNDCIITVNFYYNK